MVSLRILTGDRPGTASRRLAAWLGLLALLFNILLPVTQIAVRDAQAANGIEHVVLCSALGFKIVALKDGMPVDADPEKAAKASRTCPVCLGHAPLDHAVLPARLLPAAPAFSLTVLYGSAPDSTPAQASHLPQQARAPPVFRS